MAEPVFSVVLTTYNRQDYLDEAIRSVLAQTVDDFELIVVDDASPQPAVVPSDPRVRLLRHNENSGLAAARNTGIDAAKGRHLTFIDDDDLFDPRRLEMVVPALDRTPVVLCWFNYIGSEASGRVLDGVVAEEMLSTTTPSLGATTVRRDAAVRFNVEYLGSQDVEWWIRMAHQPVTTVPEVGYWVRKHDGERLGNGPLARIAASRRMLQEHAEFFAEHPRAAAFRWKRIGMMSAACGKRRDALAAYARSIAIDPDWRTVAHAVRAFW